MVKVLIVYYTRTGNTEKMARLVAEGAEKAGAEVTLKKAAEAKPEDLLAADAVIVGSPTYYGHMAAEIKALFDASVKFHGKLDGKVGAAFSTAANIGGGNETTILGLLQAMLIHGMVIQGNPKGDHYGPVAVLEPDKRASGQCRELGARTAALAARLSP